MASLLVRPAHEGDNQQLLKLTRDCPLLGPISFYQEREPRFFTLNELQGESYQVYVVESQGEIVGSVSCVLRWTYLNGQEVPTWYVGDLKIAPRMRGKGILTVHGLPGHTQVTRIPPLVREALFDRIPD